MSRRQSPRMRKVNELLREVIADEVHELTDPRLGFLTITGVDTSPDLRHAVVYYSVLGDAAEREDTQRALEAAASRLRAIVGHEVRLKYTPELRFTVDEAVERGIRMNELLHRLEHEEDGAPGGGPP